MHPFILTHATDSATATAAASADDARFVAGGTNLIDLMKMYVEQPRKLVNITSLDLKEITVLPDGGVRIGALVPNSDLAYHPHIRKQYPVLSEALLSGASAQLRNMATTAGNIMQRTRCPYFYDSAAPCNKRTPGAGCSAINGYNRSNAVLGGSDHCIATHPSDMCVAMAALDAIIHVESADSSKREIPFAEFHLLPGNTPYIEHELKQGELITAIEIPAITYASRSHYLKTRDRSSYEFALASAAVVLDVSGNTIHEARIGLGGVGTKPWRATEAEQILKGATLSTQAFKAAAEAALAGAKPHHYNAFKPALAKQTLMQALEITGGLS